jgi:hypothetical protein
VSYTQKIWKTGPAVVVPSSCRYATPPRLTCCALGLVTTHQAGLGLRHRSIHLCVVGGFSLTLDQEVAMTLGQRNMLPVHKASWAPGTGTPGARMWVDVEFRQSRW